jgi:thiol-disulfide isomerase/thioredoxin
MDGKGTFDMTQHRGEVVVVNFWASYCPPCRTEAPELEKVLAATRAQGVTFVGVNVHDQRDAADRYLADIKPTYGSIFDPSSAKALDFDVPPNAIPATIILDKAGRIAAVIRGGVDQPLLEPIVRDLLAEQG